MMPLHLTPNKDWAKMAAESKARITHDQTSMANSLKYKPVDFSRFHNQLAPAGPTGPGPGRVPPANQATLFAIWNSCSYMVEIFRLDTFKQRIFIMRRLPWETKPVDGIRELSDGTVLEAFIAMQNVQHDAIKKEVISDVIDYVAMQATFDSAQDLLLSHWDKGDGYSHMRRFALDYFGHTGDEDDAEMIAKVMECFFCQLVHRILDPGEQCLAELVPILYGAQGLHKTLMYPRLVLDPTWHTGQLPKDLSHKDAKLHLAGKNLVTLPEMVHFSQNRINTIKDWISVKVDVYRPPYGRRDITIPRRCGFVTEGNQFAGLDDSTGGRRFYPIEVKQEINLERLQKCNPAIWAEALHCYMAHRNNDTAWWLTREDDVKSYEIRASFRERSVYDDKVSEFINQWIPDGTVTDVHGNARIHANYRNTMFKLSVVEEFIWGTYKESKEHLPALNRERTFIREALRFAGFTAIAVNVKPSVDCKRDKWTKNNVWTVVKPDRSTVLTTEIVSNYVPSHRPSGQTGSSTGAGSSRPESEVDKKTGNGKDDDLNKGEPPF